MIELPGACDSSGLDCNTILVRTDGIGHNNYVFVSGFGSISFSTEEKIIDFKWKSFKWKFSMQKNMMPSALAIGDKHTCFLFYR